MSAVQPSSRPLEKNMIRLMKWPGLAIAVLSLQAQVPEQIRQATISGSRGTSGKCTIEVRVDMSAEVDVYGNSGRLRTMTGQPATWARMDCTDPLPYNMSDFRFRGIDGRGQVKLVQDPRNNNGMAVIRIDDPKSGSEGYTFDIEWSGASGGTPTQGFQTDVNNPATRMNNPAGTPGGYFPGRRSNRAISAERAIDLCRTEVRTRAERDYNIRNIDITAAAVDATAGRSDWITGNFSDRTGNFRRAGGYRFNCAVDYNSGQVRNIEILRADGTALQPGFHTRSLREPLQPKRIRPEPDLSRLSGRRGGPRRPGRLSERELRFDRRRHQPRRVGIRYYYCSPRASDRFIRLRLLDGFCQRHRPQSGIEPAVESVQLGS